MRSATFVYLHRITKLGEPTVSIYYNKYGQEVYRSFLGFSSQSVGVYTEYNRRGWLMRRSKPTSNYPSADWAECYTYDCFGQVIRLATPAGLTTTTYSIVDNGGSTGYATTVTTPTTETITERNIAGRVYASTVNGKRVTFRNTIGGKIKDTTPEGTATISKNFDMQGNCIRLMDPDAGTTDYEYDGWGNLVTESQQIHLGKGITTTKYNYSSTGLLLSKVRGTETISYIYDDYNRLLSMRKKQNGYHARLYKYGKYDRVIEQIDSVSSTLAFSTQIQYDAWGRVSKETYPSGYYIIRTYDTRGYLTKITDSSSRLIWQLLSCDVEGRVLQEKKGSVVTTYAYDKKGQLLSAIAPNVVNRIYTYNPITSNLLTRRDLITAQRDSFRYDSMDRLIGWNNGYNSYDADNGNIVSRWGTGASPVTYGFESQPHALNTISLKPYFVNDDKVTYAYTDFKKIKNIAVEGLATATDTLISYNYGVDEQRFRYSGEGVIRYYCNNYEEETSGGKTRKIHYIEGGSGLAAIYIEATDSTSLLNAYIDNQGSLIALAHDSLVVQRLAYDPFGIRLNPYNWAQEDTCTNFIVSRGYTMHEHIDRFKLINMNGRVFDPYTCTFLSADPYIQSPENWLNYNRYGYCLNNPLKYTDPSGELFAFIVGGLINWFSNGCEWNAKGLGCFLFGGVAGELGSTITSAVSSSLAGGATGFLHGFVAYGSGGFAGGFVLGTANSMIYGETNFGKSLLSGLRMGCASGITSGLVGGVIGGISANKEGRYFWDGSQRSKEIIDLKHPYRYSGDGNCIGDAFESGTEGGVTANQFNSWSVDKDVIQEVGKQLQKDNARLFFDSEKELFKAVKQGDVYINLNRGHMVLVNKVIEEKIITLSGRVKWNWSTYVMSPGIGQYVQYPFYLLKTSINKFIMAR